MYLWSWTFLILPVVAIAVGIGAFFAIKAIARKVKRKAAAQNALKQSQVKQKEQEKQQEKEAVIQKEQLKAPATTSQEITAQQTNPIANPQVDKQTTDIVAPQPKLSDAEYIKKLQPLPYDLKDYEIVKNDREKFGAWLLAWEIYNKESKSQEMRDKAEKVIENLNSYFTNEYGKAPSQPITPENYAGNHVVTLQDDEGKNVYDYRNYCFDGNEAPNFKKTCEKEYNAQIGDEMPTIFQVNCDNHNRLVVSSTRENMFKAGVHDIMTTMKAQNMNECTFRLVSDDKFITQKGTINDIAKFLKNNLNINLYEDNLEK